ncbi:hypothetical protein QCM80_44280 [Bradyrhizobium sp. SSUT112]|uniref:hypothetical protein n=1 Tax=Bradyrhizobium sp. SSUT112 TaxID=3040604 RepID=UPI0024492BEC|nr:hypothetical protein [Bradyrhizobium sp. SSUT112]MDH2357513.1 hypothetical protein [Bradyrhizobium sp. SSUT112]
MARKISMGAQRERGVGRNGACRVGPIISSAMVAAIGTMIGTASRLVGHFYIHNGDDPSTAGAANDTSPHVFPPQLRETIFQFSDGLSRRAKLTR